MTLYDFLDYRDYLKQCFDQEKMAKPYYSYRYVGTKTGIDPSFYMKILNKQKHVGPSKIESLVEFLKLDSREADYFVTLVNYNRTRSDSVGKELFAKLMSLKQSAGKPVEDLRYFSEWYTIPVRELLNHYQFDGDYTALAQKMNPPITERQARTAINTLTELNMIAPDSEGYLRPKETLLTTGDQWQSEAVRRFQKQMIRLGGEAIERFPKEDRDISSVTVSTSRTCLELIRERLAQARREILEMIAAEEEVDGVYQINLQVFPLTNREDS